MNKPQIHQAKLDDQSKVERMFYAMLLELDKHEHDVLPTIDNVRWFWENVFAKAMKIREEAILLATVDDELAGALFWVSNEPPWETRYFTATGWGTYVVPKFRRTGIATALRYEGTRILKRLGVDKLIGTVMVGNEASVALSKRHGLIDIAYVQQLDIT